jgi:glycosyltransferase involved in cell wall biosynthesis
MTESTAPAARLVSIVLPVYNQADHIERVIAEYDDALARALKVEREFILVVNGAGDDSYERCCRLAAERPRIHVLRSEPRGWGTAVKRGVAHASGDVICYTNSARTSSHDLALVILYATLDHHVVVKASRKIRESGLRRFGSLLYNLECRALFDLANWDVNGTPKAFPREFAKLLTLTRGDDLIDLEFNIICRREQYPMIEVPIFSRLRHGGKSTTNVGTAWEMYWGALRLWRERKGATS